MKDNPIFSQLPSEILQHILSYLCLKECLVLSRTSTYFYTHPTIQLQVTFELANKFYSKMSTGCFNDLQEYTKQLAINQNIALEKLTLRTFKNHMLYGRNDDSSWRLSLTSLAAYTISTQAPFALMVAISYLNKQTLYYPSHITLNQYIFASIGIESYFFLARFIEYGWSVARDVIAYYPAGIDNNLNYQLPYSAERLQNMPASYWTALTWLMHHQTELRQLKKQLEENNTLPNNQTIEGILAIQNFYSHLKPYVFYKQNKPNASTPLLETGANSRLKQTTYPASKIMIYLTELMDRYPPRARGLAYFAWFSILGLSAGLSFNAFGSLYAIRAFEAGYESQATYEPNCEFGFECSTSPCVTVPNVNPALSDILIPTGLLLATSIWPVLLDLADVYPNDRNRWENWFIKNKGLLTVNAFLLMQILFPIFLRGAFLGHAYQTGQNAYQQAAYNATCNNNATPDTDLLSTDSSVYWLAALSTGTYFLVAALPSTLKALSKRLTKERHVYSGFFIDSAQYTENPDYRPKRDRHATCQII